MAGAYSRDLRSRVLAAVEAGESVKAAARRFAVGRSTACRWVQAARDEGRREAKPMHGGPAPRIQGAAKESMLELAGKPHHLSLAEITARLAETHGVRVHGTIRNLWNGPPLLSSAVGWGDNGGTRGR
jgi:transposase